MRDRINLVPVAPRIDFTSVEEAIRSTIEDIGCDLTPHRRNVMSITRDVNDLNLLVEALHAIRSLERSSRIEAAESILNGMSAAGRQCFKFNLENISGV